MGTQIGKFLVATGAIIEHSISGNILLIKRSDKIDFCWWIWEYVTWRLHQFEEPEDGLIREIKEETNLDVEIIKPLSIFHIFRGEKIAENELVWIIYWCKTNSEKVGISEEHTDYIWVTPEKALEMIEIPGMKKDIEAFINERKLYS